MAPYSADFLRFWAAYPKRVGKADAWRAWQKQAPPLDAVLDALSWQCHQPGWLKDGGQFIPHPASWLHAGRWEDEPFHAPPEISDRMMHNMRAIYGSDDIEH